MNNTVNKPAYLSAKQVMLRLSIGKTAAYELMRRVPHLKFGGTIRVREDVLDDFIRHNTVRPQGYAEIKAAWRK